MDATAPPPDAGRGPMDLVRLVARFNLHPEADLHSSWLPPEWPTPYRSVARFSAAGQSLLADLMARQYGEQQVNQYNFDARLRRLALMDGSSLRRLAFYCGLCAHKPMFKLRGVAAQLRRQARRVDADAVEFVLHRAPQLTSLSMDATGLQQRPMAAGRMVGNRGYRLLLAALAPEGEAIVERVRRKLPRRLSNFGIPQLDARQSAQLTEVMLLCIVPERLPQWDWLF